MFKKYSENQYYKLWVKSQLKSLAVKIIAFFNKEDFLLKRRSENTINESDRDTYLKELHIIQNIQLPTF